MVEYWVMLDSYLIFKIMFCDDRLEESAKFNNGAETIVLKKWDGCMVQKYGLVSALIMSRFNLSNCNESKSLFLPLIPDLDFIIVKKILGRTNVRQIAPSVSEKDISDEHIESLASLLSCSRLSE